MDNNVRFKILLRNNVRYNNQYLVKLNDTERKALEKVLDMLELYNKDITYKSLMIYVDEPLLLYNKLKEYYID
jgi:hypothetical protein